MAQLRVLRIIQYCFVAYGCLLFWVILYVPAKAAVPPPASFERTIAAIAVIDAAIGFVLQKYLLFNQKARISAAANTPEKRWFAANLVRMAFILSTALFGVVLHFTGSPNDLSLFLVGLAIFLLLFGKPGTVPTSD